MSQSPRVRERSHELLGDVSGRRILDCGCGTGAALAELVKRRAIVVGVDNNWQIVLSARRSFPALELCFASATELPFANGAFDGYRAERLLQHIADPGAAIAEAHRVLAPGGRIVIIDQDYDLWAVDTDDPATMRCIRDALSGTLASGLIGRQLRSLLLDASFTDVAIELYPITVTNYTDLENALPALVRPAVVTETISQAQAQTWLDEQKRRGREDRFYAVLPFFLASATR